MIEEHFRRSLGKNYREPEPVTNSVSITGSVDDHFTKALGETWLQIKAKGGSSGSPDSSPNTHMVNINHSPSLVSWNRGPSAVHPDLLPNRFTLWATVYDSAPLPAPLAYSRVHNLTPFSLFFYFYFFPFFFKFKKKIFFKNLVAQNNIINKQDVILV